MTNQAKELYEKNVKQPLDTLASAKDKKLDEMKTYGTNTVNALRSYGMDSVHKSADMGVRLVDNLLDNRVAKLFTEPVLSFTENALDYWMPATTTTTTLTTTDEQLNGNELANNNGSITIANQSSSAEQVTT